MIVNVTGTNVWTNFKESKLAVFLHQDLKDKQLPTPFQAVDIDGVQVHSVMVKDYDAEQRITNGKVELQKGDYIMMLPKKDLQEYGDRACGHLHYFDGQKLISVYTKEVLRI